MYPKPLTAPKKPRRHYRKPITAIVLLVLLVGGYGAYAINRPFATLQPKLSHSTLDVTTPASNMPWPGYGEGAFGLLDGTVVATHGRQTPLPMASTAKLVTALVVLEKHPLAANANGPTITLGANDVALYNHYISVHGSVAAVSNGQKVTERQMLEAMLLPSANNVADSLAIWAYGSLPNYTAAANQYLAKKGISDTHIADDASGFLPNSVSSAHDLMKIGALAMSNPVIADTVGKKTATIPGTGVVSNYNFLLGQNGIVGVKTGNNDQNGGVFVGAAHITVNGATTTVITALTGASTLNQALRDSGVLLAAAPANFASTTIVSKGSVLGTYHQPVGTTLQAVAADDLNIVMLRGNSVHATVNLQQISYSSKAGQTVGSVSVPATNFAPAKHVPIVLKQTPTTPSVTYRLLHP